MYLFGTQRSRVPRVSLCGSWPEAGVAGAKSPTLFRFLQFFSLKNIFQENFTWTADVHVTLRRLAQKNMKTINAAEQKQMELGLAKARRCQSSPRPQRRLSRASWWFQQMREVVDRAK